MGVRDSIRNTWKRFGVEKVEAKAAEQRIEVQRKTVALPSILAPYQAQRALPKPTPANLRKFAETPLVRRAINIIKDRVASMDWQVRLKRDYIPDKVSYAAKRAAILRRTLQEPNDSDSFRTLIEQTALLAAGVLTVNEVRAMRGLSPLPGGSLAEPNPQEEEEVKRQALIQED